MLGDASHTSILRTLNITRRIQYKTICICFGMQCTCDHYHIWCRICNDIKSFSFSFSLLDFLGFLFKFNTMSFTLHEVLSSHKSKHKAWEISVCSIPIGNIKYQPFRWLSPITMCLIDRAPMCAQHEIFRWRRVLNISIRLEYMGAFLPISAVNSS